MVGIKNHVASSSLCGFFNLSFSLGEHLESCHENLAMVSWQACEQIYIWISGSLEVWFPYEWRKTVIHSEHCTQAVPWLASNWLSISPTKVCSWSEKVCNLMHSLALDFLPRGWPEEMVSCPKYSQRNTKLASKRSQPLSCFSSQKDCYSAHLCLCCKYASLGLNSDQLLDANMCQQDQMGHVPIYILQTPVWSAMRRKSKAKT